jgi:hypothetical protein
VKLLLDALKAGVHLQSTSIVAYVPRRTSHSVVLVTFGSSFFDSIFATIYDKANGVTLTKVLETEPGYR